MAALHGVGFRRARRRIVLDIDDTFDVVEGGQQHLDRVLGVASITRGASACAVAVLP